ncbi:ABC transporter permease protein [Streptococcus thermophilus]|nr:ABC transporter permease protein [Streptococcus thermophilus]CAD0150390.1 ABC transporter permease protein [Streptococcus thermophilus]
MFSRYTMKSFKKLIVPSVPIVVRCLVPTKWVQSISVWTPVYHVNELVVNFAKDGTFSWKSLLFILAYTVVATGLALFIKSQRESDRG